MGKRLTEKQAMRTYRDIVTVLADRLGYREGELPAADHPVRQGDNDPAWRRGPVLCRDFEGWSTTTDWAVVWEDGDYEWVHMGSVSKAADQAGVFSEPVNGFTLGLYPPS